MLKFDSIIAELDLFEGKVSTSAQLGVFVHKFVLFDNIQPGHSPLRTDSSMTSSILRREDRIDEDNLL